MPTLTAEDHRIRQVGTELGRAVGIGATAGVTADVAGLSPRDAVIVFGTTTAVAATREFAGHLRRPALSESERAVRSEIANWLVRLHRSLREHGAGSDSQIKKFEASLTAYVHDARNQKDDKLEAALIRVRADLRIKHDFGPSGPSADLLQAIDAAFALTTISDPDSLWRLKKALGSTRVSKTDYLASGGHSRAFHIDERESFQVELHPASYSVLWSTKLMAPAVVEHLHSLLPAQASRVIVLELKDNSRVVYESPHMEQPLYGMPSAVGFVRLEYGDRIFTWEPHSGSDPSAPQVEPAELGFLAEHVDWGYIAELLRRTATPQIAQSVDELIADTSALVSDFPHGTLGPTDDL
jgi:hypothetical protein